MIDTQAKRFIPVVKNSTIIPSEVIEKIANLISQPGTAKSTIILRNSQGFGVSGYAYHAGPISLCIGELDMAATDRYSKKERAGKGYLGGIAFGSRRERILFVLAHELRHRWQHVNRRPRVYGSKGRYSERDADAWALGILRRYRRGEIAGLNELVKQIPPGLTPEKKIEAVNAAEAKSNALPLNSDWPVSIRKALVKLPGVENSGGDLMAPKGKVWAATETHYLYGGGSTSDMLSDLKQGLMDCPEPECDTCHEDTEENDWTDQPKPDWSKPYSAEAIELGGNDWTERPAPIWT